MAIRVETAERTALVLLDRGATNAIDVALLSELQGILTRLADDEEVSAVVLDSAGDKFLSIGFDIPQLIRLDREGFSHFYHLFNDVCFQLYAFPRPVVAAIRGHATAGGCIFALSCDYRFIAAGRRLMGLNEIKLGVPIPLLTDLVLKQVVGVRTARDVMESGDFYQPGELLRMGMVDEVIAPPDVRARAMEKARALGSAPGAAFAAIKACRVGPVEAAWRRERAAAAERFVDCWFSDAARRRLEAALKVFQGKKRD